MLETGGGSPKVFCAVSRRRVCGPFFFGQVYLKMLKSWLMSQVAEEEEFIFQQDGAPPHWHMGVRGTSVETYQVDGLVVHQPQTSSAIATPITGLDSV
jgi:hypothetical protein